MVGYPEVILARVCFGVGGEITFGCPVIQSLSRKGVPLMKCGGISLLAHRLDRNSRDCGRSTIACLSLLEQKAIGDDVRLRIA
jgi:hypothetical protein